MVFALDILARAVLFPLFGAFALAAIVHGIAGAVEFLRNEGL